MTRFTDVTDAGNGAEKEILDGMSEIEERDKGFVCSWFSSAGIQDPFRSKHLFNRIVESTTTRPLPPAQSPLARHGARDRSARLRPSDRTRRDRP